MSKEKHKRIELPQETVPLLTRVLPFNEQRENQIKN